MSGGRIADYRSAIRAAVRGGWQGVFDTSASITAAISDAVTRHLRIAFYEGAKAEGIAPNELDEEELLWISNRIVTEVVRVPAFARAVYDGRKDGENPVKLGALFDRAELWVLQWQRIYAKGQELAGGNYKAIWRYGATKYHCADCSRVVGRVYRIKTWDKYGWIPGSRALACGGWRCDCRRVKTDQPVTPGRPPSIMGRA